MILNCSGFGGEVRAVSTYDPVVFFLKDDGVLVQGRSIHLSPLVRLHSKIYKVYMFASFLFAFCLKKCGGFSTLAKQDDFPHESEFVSDS